MKDSNLTLFYDGFCPLCVAEMQQLSRLDEAGRLRLVDIHEPDFCQRYPHIDRNEANRILHAELEDGSLLLGLDVTVAAWSRVGRKGWLKLLRWPVIRNVADLAYLFFARYRYGISWLLTGKRRCSSCALPVRQEKGGRV